MKAHGRALLDGAIASIGATPIVVLLLLGLAASSARAVGQLQGSDVDPSREQRLRWASVVLASFPPVWEGNTDEAGAAKIRREALNRLARLDPSDLREVVKRYCACEANVEGPDDCELSRIYALNRFVFAVPEWCPVGSALYGAIVRPVVGAMRRELWPFNVRSDGELEMLGGELGFSTGPPYKALAEFDQFKAMYGVRKRPGFVEAPASGARPSSQGGGVPGVGNGMERCLRAPPWARAWEGRT